MKISIGCTQRFDVTVTRPLVALLTKLGKLHYDSVCKAAVNCGGFIYGWANSIDFAEVEESIVGRIDNGQLQTSLKICENFLPSIPAEENILRLQFSTLGRDALRQADEDPRFAHSVPVGQADVTNRREATEIEKLRAENSRLYSQAVALLHFVPPETKVGDIHEIRAKYDEWLKAPEREPPHCPTCGCGIAHEPSARMPPTSWRDCSGVSRLADRFCKLLAPRFDVFVKKTQD